MSDPLRDAIEEIVYCELYLDDVGRRLLDRIWPLIAAAVAAGTEPVYPGGGLAFTELQPTAGDQRAVLAELANDSQDMGTYDGWPAT